MPIRAIFFDAGDTLVHKWAPKAERFHWLCRQAGIALPDDPARPPFPRIRRLSELPALLSAVS